MPICQVTIWSVIYFLKYKILWHQNTLICGSSNTQFRLNLLWRLGQTHQGYFCFGIELPSCCTTTLKWQLKFKFNFNSTEIPHLHACAFVSFSRPRLPNQCPLVRKVIQRHLVWTSMPPCLIAGANSSDGVRGQPGVRAGQIPSHHYATWIDSFPPPEM